MKKDYRIRILKYFIVGEEKKAAIASDSNDNVDENVRKTGKESSMRSSGSHFTNIYFTLSKHEQSFKSLGA